MQSTGEQQLATRITFGSRWLGSCLKAGMKLDMGKVHRSGVYYLINTVAPINHASKAGMDILGSVIVVVLLLGVVSLVRLVLGWA